MLGFVCFVGSLVWLVADTLRSRTQPEQMVFLPFRKLSNRGAAVAVGVCIVLSVVNYKLDEIEKSNPKRLYDEVPWRKKTE